MENWTVKVDNLQHVPSFQNGKAVQNTLVTFHVGKLGPFTQTFEAGKDDAGAINAALNSYAANLRAVQGIEY